MSGARSRLGTPYKRVADEIAGTEWDVIVVGSGMGGLAVASLLTRHGGKRVLVLERHYTAGGYTHVFHRPGYEWDVGVHYIGDLGPRSMIRTLFEGVGDGSLEWQDMGPVYDRILVGDRTYAYPKGEENLKASLKERFPAEAQAIDAYFRAVREARKGSLSFHTEKALPPAAAFLAGPFLRRRFLRWSDRTTREVLEELTRDQELIAVLTGQFGDYGLPPAESSFAMHAMVTGHYFEGGWYPVGGAGSIAASIIPVIESGGGRVLINAAVDEIEVEGNRAVGVRMAEDGRLVRAPTVVSDAGVRNTFGRLLPEPVRRRHRLGRLLERIRPSHAYLCLYVGLNGTAEELGMETPNLWIYPNERHEENIRNYLEDPGAPLPMVYASFPAAKDPDFARRHPGHSTVDLITLARYEWFAEWAATAWKKRGGSYEALKEDLAERLLAVLYERLPRLRGRVETWELSTPLTTEHFANYATGELYGIEHSPSRFRQRWLKPRTPVKGLWLTGQDVASCGVAGALFGAVLTASALQGSGLMRRVVRDVKERRRAAAGARA